MGDAGGRATIAPQILAASQCALRLVERRGAGPSHVAGAGAGDYPSALAAEPCAPSPPPPTATNPPVSFFEAVNNAHFNSLAMIDADGTILGVYRKSHIPDGTGCVGAAARACVGRGGGGERRGATT